MTRLGRMGALSAPAHNKIANPSSRCVFHVDALNAASYPGSGSTWTDISIYARAGSLSGPVWNSSGWFTYTSDESTWSPASSTVPTGTEPITLSAVFQTTNVAASQEVMGLADISDTGRVGMWIDGSGYIGIETNGSAVWTNAWAGTANTWVHLTAVSTGPNRHDFDIYVNGVKKTTTTLGTNSARSVYNGFLHLCLGNIPWHPTVQQLDGKIALAKVWSVSLTAAQVDHEFQIIRSRFGL